METVAGLAYARPQVILLQHTGIGTSEYAARSCYDSFEASENCAITDLDGLLKTGTLQFRNQTLEGTIAGVNDIEHSNLLDQLAWTHFHHSILEHANLTYLIKGTPRGVLQEHARHRIQAISVRSTRYTMSSVINAYVASTFLSEKSAFAWFADTLESLDLLVTTDRLYNDLEYKSIYDKLAYQHLLLDDEFFDIAVAKSSVQYLKNDVSTDSEFTQHDYIFNALQSGKSKRNVGDSFKHIVTDNWKVDMVVTFNLRSLKNYFQLRDSGAAYFGIRWLAEAMKQATPQKYLDLIIKGK